VSSSLFNSSGLAAEVEKARRWVTESRRRANTRLVTAGHVIEPPFRLSYVTFPSFVGITITGSNDSVTIRCNEVVASPFRPGQLELLLFDSQRVLIEKRVVAALTENHWRILQAFPPGTSCTSEELYAGIVTLAGLSQRHARRRWKELKYNYGFDVDFDRTTNTYTRSLSPVPIKDPELRPDDKMLQAAFLRELADASMREHEDSLPHCNRCDARVIFSEEDSGVSDFDDVGLLDHRRPVFQGGNDELRNLQIFCQTCNNKKNNVCRRCPYQFKCDTCHWAFPEDVAFRRLVLILNQDVIDKIRRKYGNDAEARVAAMIERIVSQ
jgi:hypothetical protein